MTMVFRFVIEAIKGIPQYYQDNRGMFLFTIGVVLVMFVYHLLYALRLCSQIRNPIIRILFFAAELLGSLAILLSGIMFNLAGEIAELKPDMLTRRSFVEIIVAAVFYCLFYAYVSNANEKREERERKEKEWTSADWEDSSERDAEIATKFLSGIAIIILSVIFMFTGTGFVTLGPVLFGKTIGKWFFNLYAGWTTSALILFVAALIEIPLIILFGNRTGAALEDFEDVMDKGIDAAVNKGEGFFERISSHKSSNGRTSGGTASSSGSPVSRANAGRQQQSEKRSVWKTILIVGAVVLALFFAFRVFARLRSLRMEAENAAAVQGKSIQELTEMAEDGNVDAMRQLGYQYNFGYDVEKDQERALYWYVKAAEAGDADSQREAGFLYANGGEELRNYDEALKWSMAAAEQENTYACVDLGLMYQYGDGVEKNFAEAEKWYMKAYDLGYVYASFYIGNLYLSPPEPNLPDAAAAAAWFEKGVKYNDQICAIKLAQLYEDGNGVEQSYEKAAELYLKAAEGDYGIIEAQYQLGILYENGWGVQADREEALRWYKKAADRGHNEALSSYNRLSGN